MSHTHNHHSHAGNLDSDSSTKNIWIAFLINLAFATLELAGGLFTGSVAILADALHDFGDSLVLGLSLILEKFAKKEKNFTYTYGYRRLSLLASLITSLVLCIGSIFVLYEAAPQFWAEDAKPPNGPWMIALAVIGVSVNGFAALRLRKGKTRNETSLSWHLIEDVMGWVAVLIGAIVITLTNWTWVDPLLACGVAIFILYNVAKNLWLTTSIFLQRTPENFDETLITNDLKKLSHVLGVHDIHAWSLDGDRNVISLHIVVANDFNFEENLEKLKSDIKNAISKTGRFHTTIEIEKASLDCPEE